MFHHILYSNLKGKTWLSNGYGNSHGLRTPNEGINQRNLMWQTKYATAVPKNLGVGVDFRSCSEGDFLTGRP